MRRRCYWLGGMFSAICVVLISMSVAQPPVTDTPVKSAIQPVMKHKLDRAKNILEGLTMEDHQKVASNARGLKLLSLEAGWRTLQTKEYELQSADFRRACDMIAKAADQKDTQRAALAYVALTVRCVECHTYIRQQDSLGPTPAAENTESPDKPDEPQTLNNDR